MFLLSVPTPFPFHAWFVYVYVPRWLLCNKGLSSAAVTTCLSVTLNKVGGVARMSLIRWYGLLLSPIVLWLNFVCHYSILWCYQHTGNQPPTILSACRQALLVGEVRIRWDIYKNPMFFIIPIILTEPTNRTPTLPSPLACRYQFFLGFGCTTDHHTNHCCLWSAGRCQGARHGLSTMSSSLSRSPSGWT